MRFPHSPLPWRRWPAWTLPSLLVLAAFAHAESQPTPAGQGPVQREIWIPEKEIGNVLKKHPKAILLTKEKYEALIRDAGPVSVNDADEDTPTTAVLRDGTHHARIVGSSVLVEAEFTIECLMVNKIGWSGCSLPLGPSELAQIKVDGEAAVRLPQQDPADPLTLFVRGKGPHKVFIQSILATKESPGGASIEVKHPGSTASSYTLELPERFDIHSGLPCVTKPSAQKGFKLHEFVLPADPHPIQIAWSSREISALAGGAVLQTCSYLYHIEPSRITSDLGISLRSSMSRVPQSLTVTLPPDVKVIEATGADLLNWTIEGAALKLNLLSAGLKESSFRLVLESEPSAGVDANAPLTAKLPLPAVEGVHRAAGSFAVIASEETRVRSIITSGLTVQTRDGLPANASNRQGFVAGFTFPILTAPPEITFVPAKARFQADLHTQVDLRRDAIYLQHSFRVLVVEGHVFSSSIRLPDNEQVLSVKLPDGTEPKWKPTGGGSLEFSWPDGLKSGSSQMVSIKTRRDPDKWADLGEDPAKLEFKSPEISGPELITGYVGLESDPQLQTQIESKTGLETSDPRRLAAVGVPIHGQLGWSRSGDFSLTLAVSKRASDFNAEITGIVLPTLHTCELNGQIQLSVKNSGLRTLTVSASGKKIDQMHFNSPNIAEQHYDAAANSWTLTFRENLLGAEIIPWQLSLPLDGATKSPATDQGEARFRTDLPVFSVAGADRLSGSWVIEANTDTELILKPEGMDEGDTLTIPSVAGYTPKHRIIAAYDWRGSAWKLGLEGIRHQSVPVPGVIVEDLQIDSVLTPDGSERRQIACQLRANGFQFFTIGLPADAHLLTLTVNGETAKPIFAPEGLLGKYAPPGAKALRISLPTDLQSAPCVFRVAYETTGQDWKSSGAISLAPTIMDPAIPVMASNWRLYLPDGFSYKEFSGNMHKEFETSTPRLGELLKQGLGALANGKTAQAPKTDSSGKPREYTTAEIERQRLVVGEKRNKMLELEKSPDTTQFAGTATRVPPAEQPASGPRPVVPPPPAKPQSKSPDDSASDLSGIRPLDINLPAAGRAFIFTGQHAPGALSFQYVGWRQDMRTGWIWCIAGAVGAWVYARKRPVFLGLVGAFVLHFGPGFVGSDATRAANALLLGWGAVCALRVLYFVLRRFQPSPLATAATALGLLCVMPMQNSRAQSFTLEKLPAALDVFVPFDPTKPLADQQPAKFFIDYEQFQKLWKQSKATRHLENSINAKENESPWISLMSALYQVKTEKGKLVISGRLSLHSSGAWQKIVLPFTGASVRSMQLDQAAAPLTEGALLVETPGAHLVEVELELPLENNWEKVSLAIPAAASGMVSLTAAPEERFRINGGTPTVESDNPAQRGGKIITAALGGSNSLTLERFLHAQQGARADKPALAKVESALFVSPSLERLESHINLSFPGTERREFSIDFDEDITPLSFEVANLESWNLKKEGGRSILEIRLADPARDVLNATLTGERQPAKMPVQEAFPKVSAQANRVEQTLMLYTVDEVNVTLHPTPAHQQINFPPRMDGTDAGFNRTACYAASGSSQPLTYELSPRLLQHTAQADYLLQISPGKFEIHVAMELKAAEGQDLLVADVPLPENFRVTRADSNRLQDWQVVDRVLRLRFSGETPEKTTMILGLARDWEAIPEKIEFAPLSIMGFKEISGRGAIVAMVGTDSALTFDESALYVREMDLAAIPPSHPSIGGFATAMPYEIKRAFTFDHGKFHGTITLSDPQPTFDVRWIMAAQVHDTWVQLSIPCDIRVKSGALKSVSLQLPAALRDVKIEGDEVRDVVRSLSVDGKTAELLVSFHNPVISGTQISLSTELGHSGQIALPQLSFPNASVTDRFFVAENASEWALEFDAAGSSHVQTMQATEAVEAAPFLIRNFSTPIYFKARADWVLKLRLEKLETANGPKAVATLCELTTALRTNGEEYLKAVYHLQNRSLQFLPLRLPQGMELISAKVAGATVRADAGIRDGQPTLLIPLIQTRVGDLAMDITILARRPSSGKDLPKAVSLDLADPDLPGIAVEKTLWTVCLPPGYTLKDADGNMDRLDEEKSTIEKIRNKLEEGISLSSVLSSSRRAAYKDNAIYNGEANWREIDEEVRKIEHTSKGKELKEEIVKQRAEWTAKAERAQTSRTAADDVNGQKGPEFVWDFNSKDAPKPQADLQIKRDGLELNDVVITSNSTLVDQYKSGDKAKAQPEKSAPVAKRKAASGKLADSDGKPGGGGGAKEGESATFDGEPANENKISKEAAANKQGLNYQGSSRHTEFYNDMNAPVTESEIAKRQADAASALELEAGADRLVSAGDFASATTNYKGALSNLGNPTPKNADLRRRISDKLANTSVSLARELGKRGEFDAAKSVLNTVLSVSLNPKHEAARKLLKQLDDPQYFNMNPTTRQEDNIEAINHHFKLGLGYSDLAKFEEAIVEFNRVLAIDPFNVAARRQLERVQREMASYNQTSRDYTRRKMLGEVDVWDTPAPDPAAADESDAQGVATVNNALLPGTVAGLNSLPVDLVTTGQKYFFQKVKDNARINLKATRASEVSRDWSQLVWLAVCLAALVVGDGAVRKLRAKAGARAAH